MFQCISVCMHIRSSIPILFSSSPSTHFSPSAVCEDALPVFNYACLNVPVFFFFSLTVLFALALLKQTV